MEGATPTLPLYAFLACTETNLPVSTLNLAMFQRSLLPPSARCMFVLSITSHLTSCISERARLRSMACTAVSSDGQYSWPTNLLLHSAYE